MSKLKIPFLIAIFGIFLFNCSDVDANSTITNPTQEVPQILSTNLVNTSTSTFDGKNAVKVELTSAYQTEINNSGTGAGNGPSYAIVGKDFQNGTIEVEIAAAPNTLGSPTSRGFAGLAFHIDENSKDYEAVYFRMTNGTLNTPAPAAPLNTRAIQYVAHPNFHFNASRGQFPGFYEKGAPVAANKWHKLKLEINGTNIKVSVDGTEILNLKDLKYAHQNGSIGLWVDVGTTAYFRNLTITKGSATTPFIIPSVLNINSNGFFPEDVHFYNGSAYVTGFGNGSLQKFDFTTANPTAQQIAAATDATNSSRWGIAIDPTRNTILTLSNAQYFFNGNVAAPAKVEARDLTTNQLVNTWTLPAGTVGNSIVVAAGNYYIGDIGPTTRIIKLNPADGSTTIKTDAQWNNGFGFGGMVFRTTSLSTYALYAVHGGKLWNITLAANGDLGTVTEVTGISNVFADGMTWAGGNTLYYAENDAQNPANAGIVYKVTLNSNNISGTATQASIPSNGSLNNPSGVNFQRINNKNYLFVNESQIFNTPTTPFKVNIHEIN
jgi:hypothetical protein